MPFQAANASKLMHRSEKCAQRLLSIREAQQLWVGWCRLLEAYGSGFYWIAAVTLAFIGTFFGLLLSAAFDSNLGMTGGKNKANYKVNFRCVGLLVETVLRW